MAGWRAEMSPSPNPGRGHQDQSLWRGWLLGQGWVSRVLTPCPPLLWAARSPAPTTRATCTTPSTSSSRSRAGGWRRRGWSCRRGSGRLEPPRPQVSPPCRGRCAGAGTLHAAGGALSLPSLSRLRAWLGRPPAAASPGPPDRSLWFAGSGRRVPLGPEDVGEYSTATLRILASMPSRTIGEWAPLPWPGRPGFQRDLCCVELGPLPRTLPPAVRCLGAQHSPSTALCGLAGFQKRRQSPRDKNRLLGTQ